MPFVSPVTVIVPLPACVNVPVIPPGDEVAVYEIMVEPPLLPGAVKGTHACALFPAVAVPIVGAPGKPDAVPAVRLVQAVPL